MNIDKNQTKLAAEVCRKMADLSKDLELTHNVRAHAIKTSLKYTLQACGLIECQGCHEFSEEAMPQSKMCNDCLMGEFWTDDDASDMDEAGQII